MHLYFDDRGSCHGSLYSDDGDGYTLGRVDYLDCTQKAGKWNLKWQGEGDAHFPYEKVEIITHGLELGELWVGDRLIDRASSQRFIVPPLQTVSFTGILDSEFEG